MDDIFGSAPLQQKGQVEGRRKDGKGDGKGGGGDGGDGAVEVNCEMGYYIWFDP